MRRFRQTLIWPLIWLCGMALFVPQVCAQATPQAAVRAHPWLSLEDLRRRYADRAGRFITIKGMDIHYKDEGPRNATALLLIHGSVSTMRTWDGVAARLKPHYRVIRFDLPGFGLSGPVSDAAAAAVQPVEVTEGLLDALKVRKATAIGVSSGGTMAIYLAARRPDLVERLIVSNTPSDPVDTSHLVMPAAFLAAQARAKADDGFQDRDFWDHFLDYFSGDPHRISDAVRTEYYDFNRRAPDKHPVAMIARIADGKQAAIEMAKVQAPTLLIWGGADPLLPDSAADTLTRYLSHAQVSRIMMPDVGHFPPLEVADRFARWVADYIEAGVPDPRS